MLPHMVRVLVPGSRFENDLYKLRELVSQSNQAKINMFKPFFFSVVVLDAHLINFYSKVNTYWQEHNNSTLKHVTVVSSGGGEYDVQVRGGLTPLDGVSYTCME